MTDRELLELAAKAAKLEGYSNELGHGPIYRKHHTGLQDWVRWNPLTDDGDALRLAVQLNLSADFFYDEICVGYTPNSNTCDQLEEPVNDNPYAATRRAITRAAAEIGRAMG